LEQLESKRNRPVAISKAVLEAPFTNLDIYPMFIQGNAEVKELGKNLSERAKKFIQISLEGK
jgi:hypothetical protein